MSGIYARRLRMVTVGLLVAAATTAPAGETSDFGTQRAEMVQHQIAARGVSDPRVLQSMRKVPRHRFVPEGLRAQAYSDRPLPIGEGQTISQPYIVALMTEALSLQSDSRVLEIGTGSGYQAAVLAEITPQVYSVEIKPVLAEGAARRLRSLGYDQVQTRRADGYYGWESAAPFDAIMITAAVDHIPPPLLAQLKDGGRLVLPLGNPFSYQNLVLVTRHGDSHTVRQITGVLFVPMTGDALRKP
ncbi:MAG TPA: protein-L-isoaspartate(D-aspartate) O-methyltransferase [Desulfobacterales bacterium]